MYPTNSEILESSAEPVGPLIHAQPALPGFAMERPVDGGTSMAAGWRLPDEGINLEDLVRSLTLQAVERSGANVSRAARMLGISRATLRYRLKKYGVAPCRG